MSKYSIKKDFQNQAHEWCLDLTEKEKNKSKNMVLNDMRIFWPMKEKD